MASITLEARQALVALYVGMFKAAPGAANLSSMVQSYEGGKTMKQIAADLDTADFRIEYPAFLTAEEFADKLIGNLLGDNVPASAKTWATGWVTNKLQSGVSDTDVIVEAVNALRATDNTNYTTAQTELTNKVEVAEYYSITKQQSSDSLSTLQSIISNVTSDTATVTSAKSSVDTSVAAALAKTFALTTGLDTGTSFTGGDGDDTFSATDTTTATTTTFTTGDSLVGGAGTDKLSLSVSGNNTGNSVLASTSGIETLEVFNNSTTGTQYTVQADLMTGLEKLIFTGGTAVTVVDELGSLPNVELSSVNKNVTITKKAAVGTGTSDAATITVNGVATTANTTVSYSGLETINLVTSGSATGSATTSLTITSTDLETLNVTGTTDLNITSTLDGADNVDQTGTFDSSAATGNITAALTAGSSTKLAATFGAGDDVLTVGTMDKDWTLNGGEGSDRLVVDGATYSSTSTTGQVGDGVTNFEVLALTAGNSADVRAFSNNAFTSLRSAGNATFTGLGTDAVSLTASATAAGTVKLDRATDGTADAATVTLAAATPGTFATLDVADEETLTLVSNGTAAGTNTITTLTGTDLKTLNISGTRSLTVTNAVTGTALATLDASGLTGSGVALNINASNSTAAMTVTAGAGTEASAGDTMNTITTGSGADTITGGAYKDVITSGNGHDSIVAGAGNDTITTSFGNDYVDAGDGDDTVTDSSGNDTVLGGAGNDTLDVKGGTDSVDGGEGNDKIYVSTLDSNDTVAGGAGTDTLSLSATSSTLAASFYTDVTDSITAKVTGVETAYLQVTTGATHTTTAPLNLDLTSVTDMTTLYLDVVSANSEALKVTNFGGSSIIMTELAGGQDPEFVNIDGTGQTLTLTVQGFKPATGDQGDMTFTGIGSLTIVGDSYVSTTAQSNEVGTITADSVDTFILKTDGVGSAANNGNALLIEGVSADNASTVTLEVGKGDTLTSDNDIEATNSLVQNSTVTVGENGTLTVTGGDINLGSSSLTALTVTNGIGGTISAVDIAADSAATFTGTLNASSTSTLDLDFAITSGTVTMSTSSTWTLATAGKAGKASSLTVKGYGDVVEGTNTALVGTTFTYDLSGLTDGDGVQVTGNALTGAFTFKGTNGADTVIGGSSADTLTGNNGADSITGGNGKDTIDLTETVAAADNVVLASGSANYDNITAFSAGGGASNDNVFAADATFAWFGDGTSDNDGAIALQSAATIKAAKAADDNVTVITITTNATASTFDDFVAGTKTEAEMETAVITAMGLTGAMTASDIILVFVDDGEDTGIFKFTGGDAATDDAVDAAEIEIIGILQGVSDASTILAADVLFS